MRKIIFVLLSFILLLLILRFIPSARKKELIIKNKLEYADQLISLPENWKKWYVPVKTVWEKDPGACSVIVEEAGRAFRLKIPGREIRLRSLPGLRYEITLSSDGASNRSVLAVSPAAANNHTNLAHVSQSNLLSKLVPDFSNREDTDEVLNNLKLYMEDSRLFYGFNMYFERVHEKGLVTSRFITTKQEIFPRLKNSFNELEQYVERSNGGTGLTNSISYISARGDSVEILAGIAVNSQLAGNDSIRYMQVSATQQLLIADYEGIYLDRKRLYAAMAKFMGDRNIQGRAGFYESFAPGAFPRSDSAMVKMRLCFPLSGKP